MKNKSLILAAAMVGLTAQAQDEISLSMGAGYENRVFYKLSNETSQSFPKDNWDLALYRADAFSFGTRINDAKGLKVYEASDDVADWENLDVADIGSWNPLYNSDTQWDSGAFENGSATYGWGEYNSATHHIEGSILFVIEDAQGGYTKFYIEDYFNGYTFTYATWNGSNWDADQTETISNTENEGKLFNYFALSSGQTVVAEPNADDWDLVFMQYTTDVGGGMMYPVTGVLHHPETTVAKHDETTGAADIHTLDFQAEINTIGWDWKTFDGGVYQIDSDTAYYTQTADGEVYKIIFTTFEGGSTGNIEFTVEKVGSLNAHTVAENAFALYPNPTQNKQVNLQRPSSVDGTVRVTIYNLTGAKVFETQTGQTHLNLSQLHEGVYLVNLSAGNWQETKKLVVR